MTILEIVNQNSFSVRLTNCIRAAFKEDACPIKTVEEYLLKGSEAINLMLEVPRMGIKSASELDDFIWENYKDNLFNLGQGETVLYGQGLLEYPIAEVLKNASVSVRLTNCYFKNYEKPGFPFVTIQDFLLGSRKKKLIAFKKYQNVGVNTISEFERVVESFIEKCLEGKFDLSTDVNSELEENNNQAVFNGKEVITFKGDESLLEVISVFSKGLTSKESIFLKLRYDYDSCTLQEIGDLYEITRERVRQIVKKAFRRIMHGDNVGLIEIAFACEEGKVIEILFPRSKVIHDSDVIRQSKKLSYAHRLAIDMLYGSVKKWMKSNFKRLNDFYYISNYTRGDIKKCVSALNSEFKRKKGPIVYESFINSNEFDRVLIDLTIELSPKFSIFEKLVFNKSVGRGNRRVARLYSMLLDGVLDVHTLTRRHNSIAREEMCSSRDVHIYLNHYPHLFLSVGDEGWTAIKPKGVLRGDCLSIGGGADSLCEKNQRFGAEGVVMEVYRTFEQHGPLHFSDIVTHFNSDNYSRNSVGPVVLLYELFIKLAPGVYGIKEHLNIRRDTSVLMNESDCKQYVIARYSEERQDQYPYWSFDLEYSWCKWAMHNVDKDLFESLLYISKPEEWNVDVAERDFWLNIKKLNSKYHYTVSSRHELRDYIPSPREFCAVLTVLCEQKEIGWITINRILGNVNHCHYSASVLALLVCCKAVEPHQDWQKKHMFRENALACLSDLEDALYNSPKSRWDAPKLGQMFKDYSFDSGSFLGWVDVDDLAQLLDMFSNDKKIVSKRTQKGDEASTLDSFLTALKSNKRSEVMGKYVDDVCCDI